MSHRDAVFEPPEGFTALASSPGSPVAALEDNERRLYGIQFHPEVVHTPYGQEILERFLTEIAGCDADWSPASVIDRAGRASPRRRSAMRASSAGSRAASTPRPRRRSSTAPSATSSPACSSTTA